MARVKVYNDAGMAERTGTGVFARAVMTENPLLPVEEEGRLNDPDLREKSMPARRGRPKDELHLKR